MTVKGFGHVIPIGQTVFRRRAAVLGTVEAVELVPFSGVPALECRLSDGTGRITVVFLGRRQVEGVEVGARLLAEGMVGRHRGLPAIVNPETAVFGHQAAGGEAS